MSKIQKYYSQILDNLNNEYSNYTNNYLVNYLNFKQSQLSYNISVRDLNENKFDANNSNSPYLVSKKNLSNLNGEYLALTAELKTQFSIKSNSINEMQQSIDELTVENDILLQKSNNFKDANSASKPFLEDERLVYYRSIIYLISIVAGIIFILYLLQSTPFIAVTKTVVENTKNLATNAVTGAKGAILNEVNNANADGSDNSMSRNLIILLLVSIVVIAVFYFIIYLIRRVQPSSPASQTDKKIKQIADSCKRDKSESWIKGEIDKIKTFFLNPNNVPNTNNGE